MSLWGNGTSSKEDRPKWLKGQFAPEDCYMTARGWVYRWPKTGVEEVIAAINSTKDTLMGQASLASLAWGTNGENSYKNGVLQTLYVSFNEKVVVNTGIVASFAITGGGAVTATYIPSVSGTITTLTTSNTVTGASTKFKSELKVNDILYTSATTPVKIGVIAAIFSDTSLALFSNAASAVTAAVYLKSENKLKFTFTPSAVGAISVGVTTMANIGNIRSADAPGTAAEVAGWTAAVNTKLGSKTIVA